MSGYPQGWEFLEAQFAEIARQVIEQARQERLAASPWAYGDKINLGQEGGFVGALPAGSGGTGTTTGAPAGETFGTAYTVAGDVALRADGTIATKRY